MKRISLVGRTFERLFVFADAPSTYTTRSWVRCACGTELIVTNAHLKTGCTGSCGCLMRDRTSAANSTHRHTIGYARTRTYRAWTDMTKRCRKPRGRDVKNYAHVIVCERWVHSFENFLADMGECPVGLTLDRWPNKFGNYEPGNCRWATVQQQARNKRNNRILTVRGVTGCFVELAEHFGIPRTVAKDRLLSGWSAEDAFTNPISRGPRSCQREDKITELLNSVGTPANIERTLKI